MSDNRRKTIALGAAALMTLSGLTVGTATASAQAVDTSQCKTSQTVTHNWLGSAGNYTLAKAVLGDGTAAPGGEVTFQTTVSGAGGLITRIEDYHPEGFELVRARQSVWKLVGGQTWENVTSDVERNASKNMVARRGSGWTTAGNNSITLETTYKVPKDAKPGEVLNTGAAFDSVLASGYRVSNPINTCVTIREPNAVESVTGSLDGLGLGSVTSGSTAAGGISSDPASFSTEIINGIDIGKLIGLS